MDDREREAYARSTREQKVLPYEMAKTLDALLRLLDESRSLGRELAEALAEAVDEPWKGKSYERCCDALARARAAGWLDGSAPSA